MRTSSRNAVMAVLLFSAGFAGCGGSSAPTEDAGGGAGSGGSNAAGTGGTCNTGTCGVGGTCNTGTCGVGGTGGAGNAGMSGSGGDAGMGNAGTGGAGGSAGKPDGGFDATGGAGGNAGTTDAGFDRREDRDGSGGSAGSNAEGGRGDVTDAEAGTFTCATAINGTTPFGVAMFADVSYPLMDGGTFSAPVRAQLYFPTGRVPGAPVVLTGGNVGGGAGSGTVARGTLDSAGNFAGLTVSDSCANGIRNAALSNMFLAGTAVQNMDPFMSSDALVLAEAPARLCPNGPVQDAGISKTSALIWPTSRIALEFTSPVDLATRSTIKLAGSNRALVVSGGESLPAISVTPQSGAFAPGDLTLDISGLRDVLGRPYGDSVVLQVQKPMTAIVDRTLTTAPPTSVWVSSGNSLIAKDGLLVMPTFAIGSEYAFTIALGDEPGSTTLQIKHRWVCGTQTTTPKTVTLVASDGATVEVPGNCASAPETTSVTLAGSGPYFLVVHEGYEQSPRCNLPGPPTRDGWELDEFAFAP